MRDPKTVTTSRRHKDYPATMALDGKADTRWAVDGNHWIQFKLDPTIEFSELTIGWYEANVRKWDFDRLGIMSQQDQGAGVAHSPPTGIRPSR